MIRVAFLGLGIMGSRMAANLARADVELAVWNRTAEVAERFAAEHAGVRVGASPAAAAADCDVVFTMVVDGAQVRDVLLGEGGAALDAAPDTVFVDCSTIGPAATRELGAELAERSMSLVDAPVTGSAPRAQDGTLTFMVGATDEDLQRVRPLIEIMGELIVHAGPPSHGQMIKIISNSLAAANAAAVGQALLVGARAGVDLGALVQATSASAGGSRMLDLKAGPMREHDYTTLFKLEHMLKDVRMCLEEGQRLGVPFPSAAFAREILTAAMGMGHAEDDFAALIEPLEGAAGVRL